MNAGGSNLTPLIFLVGLSELAKSAGMKMHMGEDIAKQLRAFTSPNPDFEFPIVVSLRTPPGEIHFRDPAGELRGKIIGVGVIAAAIGAFE